MKRYVFLIIIITVIAIALVFSTSEMRLPIAHCDELPTNRNLVVFMAQRQTVSGWGRDKVWIYDPSTGMLGQWDAVPAISNLLAVTRWFPAAPFYPGDGSMIFSKDRKVVALVHESGATETLAYGQDWSEAVFSPDREFVAYVTPYRSAANDEEGLGWWFVIERVSSHLVTHRWSQTLSEQDYHITWAPDSRRIAFARGTASSEPLSSDGSALYYVSLDDGEPIQLSPRLVGGISAIAWNPDGTRIAFAQTVKTEEGYAQLWVVDVVDGESTPYLPPQRGEWVTYTDLAWSADGQQLAYVVDAMLGVERAGSLGILNTATGENLTVIDGAASDYWYTVDALAWAPGPEPVVIASLPGDETLRCVEIQGSDTFTTCTANLYVVDASTGEFTQLTHYRFAHARSAWLAWW